MTDYGEPWDRSNDEFNEPVISDRNVIPKAECYDEKEADRIISCVNACAGIEDPERVVPLLVELAAAAEPYTGVSKAIDTVLHEIAALQPKREW